jgi:hypothetical protein
MHSAFGMAVNKMVLLELVKYSFKFTLIDWIFNE